MAGSVRLQDHESCRILNRGHTQCLSRGKRWRPAQHAGMHRLWHQRRGCHMRFHPGYKHFIDNNTMLHIIPGHTFSIWIVFDGGKDPSDTLFLPTPGR